MMTERPGRELEPPATFRSKIGPEDLIPPSYFRSRTHAPLQLDKNPLAALSKATKDILELRQENERLRRMQGPSSRGRSEFEKEHISNGARPLEQERTMLACKLAEQKQEEHQAELLRSVTAQEAAAVDEKDRLLGCLAQQLSELQQRPGADLSQLYDRDVRPKSQLAQERQRNRLEELLLPPESLDGDREALLRRVAELEEELRQGREKGQCEAAHLRERLEAMGQERDTLREELSKARCNSESQSSLVQQLRTYIGHLVPDERQLEEAQEEKEWLSSRNQHLEKERETLTATVQLLNVRLTSLTDILTIQESDHSNAPSNTLRAKPTLDIQRGDGGKKAPLVTRWREKVFALMVQLKSQEISHTNDINHLQVKIADLEKEVAVKGREHALFVHSLQDRIAETKLERVKNQCLRDNLAGVQDNLVQFQEKAERADSALHHLHKLLRSFYQQFLEREAGVKQALRRLGNLTQRVSFANKRIDTIQGLCARKEALARLQMQERSRQPERGVIRHTREDLERELELLNGERDQLAAELKCNSQLMEKMVTEARTKFEAELKEQLAITGRLEHALEEMAQRERGLTEQLAVAQREQRDAREAVEALRAELCQRQVKYKEALQEKVAEAESKAAEQLSEIEKQLNEARREHTKAVVALRQADRQAARDRERLETCGKLQEEQHRRENQRHVERLRDAERDKNLLMATLRQEGLLNQFKKSRAAALHTSASLSDQSEATGTPPLSQARAKDSSKDSLAEVLKELQVLSAAVIGEREERELTDEEEEAK
ncbi:coiled-coil alpha-helical rod protein 1 isoform X2 [Narcine bancroftii]|uniref:coiled-coil alpha-helical rod protein 1 isoform X2 n=1 Tax=Narcine bancroftii TaxID=1343680 RepID=UPI003832252C